MAKKAKKTENIEVEPQTESRKMKTWTTGSVGAVTSDLDAMQMHFLSERCLVTQGANNFMLMN